MRNLLTNLLNECKHCSAHFYANVAMITDENGALSDDQVEAILVDLLRLHDVH